MLSCFPSEVRNTEMNATLCVRPLHVVKQLHREDALNKPDLLPVAEEHCSLTPLIVRPRARHVRALYMDEYAVKASKCH